MKNKTNVEITVISTRVWKADQSWYFEHVVKFENQRQSVRLKVSIRRNAYDFQSYGRVYFWDGKQWNRIVDTPLVFLRCKQVSDLDLNVNASAFEVDCERLLGEALKICWNDKA